MSNNIGSAGPPKQNENNKENIPSSIEPEKIILARARNTQAARKSRAKKLHELNDLKATITQLEEQVKFWKTKAEDSEKEIMAYNDWRSASAYRFVVGRTNTNGSIEIPESPQSSADGEGSVSPEANATHAAQDFLTRTFDHGRRPDYAVPPPQPADPVCAVQHRAITLSPPDRASDQQRAITNLLPPIQQRAITLSPPAPILISREPTITLSPPTPVPTTKAHARRSGRTTSKLVHKLLHYTGRAAKQKIRLNGFNHRRTLNPYLAEMAKLANSSHLRAAFPYDWQRARRDAGDLEDEEEGDEDEVMIDARDLPEEDARDSAEDQEKMICVNGRVVDARVVGKPAMSREGQKALCWSIYESLGRTDSQSQVVDLTED